MGDMNFPESPAVDEGYLDWSWDGEKWVHNGLTGLQSKPANITTADVKLANPQRATFKTQEDANEYFYESIQNGGDGGGGDVDLSNYYTKPESDNKFQLKGNYLTDFTEQDPTVPQHVKDITTSDINKWNNPPTGGGGGGAVDSVNGKTGTVVLSYTDVGAQVAGSYATASHNHNGVYQPAGSYAASNHNHNGVYQPVGNYATTSYSYSKAESDGKYELKGQGGGSTDTLDSVCKRGSTTGTSPTASNWWCNSNTYTLGGIAGGGARIISYDGKFVFYNKAGAASGVELSTDGNVRGGSFTTYAGGTTPLITLYGNALANAGSLGAGLYFSGSGASPSITPCRGTDFSQIDGFCSLGNPQKRFSSVWTLTVRSAERATQNNGEAVLSVNDLIEVMQDLRDATKDEKTVESLRDSIGNCVGGIIEKLEAIQAEAKDTFQAEMEASEQNQARVQ